MYFQLEIKVGIFKEDFSFFFSFFIILYQLVLHITFNKGCISLGFILMQHVL